MTPASKSQRPILHPSMIKTLCTADWEKMAGDEIERFCTSCGKSVHSVSAMTAREIDGLLGASEGEVCVRMRVRKDGSIATASRLWDRWKAPRLRRMIARVLGALAIFAASSCVRTGSVSRADDGRKEASETEAR